MAFVGSEKTITVSNKRQELVPRPSKRPKLTGDRRSKPRRRLSDEIPLREIHHDKLDAEKGFTDFEEAWQYNEVVNPDWEVDRRADLYIVGWYGPDDPEVSPVQTQNRKHAGLNPAHGTESSELVRGQEAIRNLRSVLAHVRGVHRRCHILFRGG